jgi:parallel beta-helix repeat protein
VYDSSNNNIFKNNTITNNRYCGINLRISSNNIITANTIINNNIGIHIPVEDNRIENNTFSNNAKKFDKENEFLTPGFEFVITIIVFIIIAYRKKILKVK